MSYRVLHVNPTGVSGIPFVSLGYRRERPAPSADVLGLVHNAMRGHVEKTPSSPEGAPSRAADLTQSFFLKGVPINGSRYFAPHKYVGTPPRPRKSRGLVNRMIALSPALASSVRKFVRLERKYDAERAKAKR